MKMKMKIWQRKVKQWGADTLLIHHSHLTWHMSHVTAPYFRSKRSHLSILLSSCISPTCMNPSPSLSLSLSLSHSFSIFNLHQLLLFVTHYYKFICFLNISYTDTQIYLKHVIVWYYSSAEFDENNWVREHREQENSLFFQPLKFSWEFSQWLELKYKWGAIYIYSLMLIPIMAKNREWRKSINRFPRAMSFINCSTEYNHNSYIDHIFILYQIVTLNYLNVLDQCNKKPVPRYCSNMPYARVSGGTCSIFMGVKIYLKFIYLFYIFNYGSVRLFNLIIIESILKFLVIFCF